jgi:Ser/Thr protein kinase RdoA (MazF antagonist)
MLPTLSIPVQRSLLTATALAEQLLPAYDLPADATCAFWSQSINDIYLVRAGEQRWMLRVAPAGRRTLAQQAAELELLLHLHRNGLIVPQPVPHRDGQFLTMLIAPEGPRVAVLFTFLPGTSFTATEPNSIRYGKATALLHAAMDGYLADPSVWVFDAATLIDRPLALLRPWFVHRPQDFALLTAVAERGRAAMAGLARERPNYGLCHGDLNDANFHLIGDQGWGLLDFEYVGIGWRLFDSATFISNQLVQQGSGAGTQRLVDAFLQGYEAVRPLNEMERAALPAFVALRQLWLCGVGVTNQPGIGLGLYEEWLYERCMPLFRQLADQETRA